MQDEKIKEIVRAWLKKESGAWSYVYDDKDLSEVGLDGHFDLEELANMVRKQTLEEAPQIEHCDEPDCPECNLVAYNKGRQDALEEAIASLPEEENAPDINDFDNGFNECRIQTLSNLQALKDKNK